MMVTNYLGLLGTTDISKTQKIGKIIIMITIKTDLGKLMIKFTIIFDEIRVHNKVFLFTKVKNYSK